MFMQKGDPRRQQLVKIILWFSVRMLGYVGFVLAYCFFVLLFLRERLKDIFVDHRAIYAAIVLPLIIGQAILLDFLTMVLRKAGGRKSK